MKRALALLVLSYSLLLVFIAVGAKALPLFRMRITGGFTVGDMALLISVFFYGLIVYIAAKWLLRGSCKT